MVGAAEPEARRRRAVPQSLARQDRDPGGRADRRRAALLLLRRWRAQHRRPARLRPLHRAGRSEDRASDRHPGRALDLRDPQRCRRHGGAQVAGPEGAAHVGAGRGRHHGGELPALPAPPLQVRGDHLHLPPSRDPRRLRGEVVEDPRHPGAAARQRRGGGAQAPTSPSAAPPAPTSSAASRGSGAGRPSCRWRAARWTRPAGRASTRP